MERRGTWEGTRRGREKSSGPQRAHLPKFSFYLTVAQAPPDRPPSAVLGINDLSSTRQAKLTCRGTSPCHLDRRTSASPSAGFHMHWTRLVTKPRLDIFTAAKQAIPASPYAFGPVAAMSTATKPSALTFDRKARCSVRSHHSPPHSPAARPLAVDKFPPPSV